MEPTTVKTLPEQELNSTALLTTVLILAAATMTFGALIAVFFIRSSGHMFWGHVQIPFTLWITTAVLLVSSVTLERAKKANHRGDQPAAYRDFAVTSALAVAFLIGQITAWIQIVSSGIQLKNNSHSWFVFLFVALHGLHILLGLAGVGVLTWRTHEPVSGRRYQARTRAIALGVSIFWHYLGLLWLLLFALLLLWKR